MGHTIKEIHIVLKTLGSNTVLARDAQLDDLPGPNEVRVSDVAVCFYNLINGTSNFLGALGPIVPRYDAIEVISRLNFVGDQVELARSESGIIHGVYSLKQIKRCVSYGHGRTLTIARPRLPITAENNVF